MFKVSREQTFSSCPFIKTIWQNKEKKQLKSGISPLKNHKKVLQSLNFIEIQSHFIREHKPCCDV